LLSTPLIATKFHIPPARADFIPQPRLRAPLEVGSRQPLTLISAPPGLGKTVLAADWIDARGESHPAWLSLDESDDQPALFWRYFVAALWGRWMRIGETAQEMLTTPAPPALETVLATLVNELAARDEPLILVIDGYHLFNPLTFITV
jgi:LuxR family transcriptional regulator, maltose regulon positive regulatory protein